MNLIFTALIVAVIIPLAIHLVINKGDFKAAWASYVAMIGAAAAFVWSLWPNSGVPPT
jgi:hypothetical protein